MLGWKKYMSITDYEDKIKKIVEKEDHGQFIYDFLSVYEKISKATITKLRKGSNNLSKVPGEVYLKNKLFFKETKGRVMQTYSDLEDRIDEIKSKPRYIVVTDYKQLLARDIKTGDTLDIKFMELPRYFDFFLAWNGIEKADFERENPADLKAAERFAKFFDVISSDNGDVDRHGLNLFLIRFLFCLFAEDTGIFKQDLFTDFLKRITSPDGSDMNDRLSELFSFMDKKERSGDEPAWLSDFPYVNGQLFTEPHMHIEFSAKSRKLMIDAGELIGWSKVNPDILGSMLQAVASEDRRSHLGMHYTSVPNIMKVIKPLFLDNLREDFERARGNEDKLNKLYERIGNIKFMDPACGSGNFLVIAYKELRQLEIDIIKELNGMGIATMYIPSVTLNQFYGIEIDDFACDVTRLSLWIAEHQMNKRLEEEVYNAVRPTLPLQKAGAIVCGNSLRLDWEEILPHDRDDEVYLFGNPPYLGAKKQTSKQKEDLEYSLDGNSHFKKLDYVVGWLYKGAKYIENSCSKLGFVTTNSINQGEQVAMIWPEILKYAQIFYAYKSFKWSNSAKGQAGVTVTIIGLSSRDNHLCEKKLYDLDIVKDVDNISPYITEGNYLLVESSSLPLNGLPNMVFGSMPRDDGNLILDEDEKNKLLECGVDSNIIRKYIGSKELINSQQRYCLWMTEDTFEKNRNALEDRVMATKISRLKSNAKATRLAAEKPWEFVQKGEYYKAYGDFYDDSKYSIIVPRVSSENRLYVPMGIVDSSVIISDSAMAIYDAPIWLLGLLESRMHMTWLRAVGGRLKTDYRYSAGLVYNTFPVPEISSRRIKEIENLTVDILDIRAEEGGTLAELYGTPLAKNNPKPMNERLLKAHRELDQVVDRVYRQSGFKDDSERLSYLLKMYSNETKIKDR
ncbi:class I SAM-dependent DNA methyltransferase [Ligilactobacillus ruminis]|nr:class I SAM-dependent DNA methyltransferase [Ligilactobacillus ruminis]